MQDRETKAEHRATITEIAQEALASHVISPEQESGPVRMWLCHRPGTGAYHYRVIAAPGMLLVYGDIGDHMLQANDKDLVPWLHRAINSPDYLISKFVRRPKTFFPYEAMLLLDRLVQDGKDWDEQSGYNLDEDGNEIMGMHEEEARTLKRKVLDEWDPDYDDEHMFARAFYYAGGEASLIESTRDYDSDVYWTVECLKKFVELYDEHERTRNDEEGISSSYVALDE